MTPRALVVGAKSFVGRALLDELRSTGEWDVFGSARIPEADVVELDLLDRSSVDRALRQIRPSLIFNLAAPPRDASLPEAVAVQVLGSAILLDAVNCGSDQAHVILLGSAAEYGPSSHDVASAETDSLAPRSSYAIGKALQAGLAESVTVDQGQRVTVARLFNVTGPGQSPGFLCADLIARCRVGAEPVRVEDAMSTRDLVDIRDVAAALRLVGECGEEAVYNVGTGVRVRVGDVAREIGELTDADVAFAEQVRPATHSRADCGRLLGLGWRPVFDWRRSLRDQLATSLDAE